MNLLTPLATETFQTDAATASGTFYADGRPVENGQASSASGLTITYNAAQQTYTVALAGYNGSFGAAQRVDAQSNADITAYQSISGGAVTSLALSNPGATGPLTYTYVAGGSLERSENGGTSTAFGYDAFTYGVRTPDANLPRTGTGFYSLGVIGARGYDRPLAMGGAGTMQVGFLSGALESQGLISTIDPTTGNTLSIGVFYGSGQMSSAQNSFTGRFQLRDGIFFDGGWDGRFYGPGADEVGATWHVTAPDGQFASGWLIGRQDASVEPYNMSLAPIQFAQTFGHDYSAIIGEVSNGVAAADAELFRSNAEISYDPVTGAYRYQDSAASIDQSFAPGSRDANASSSATTVYKITGGDGTAYTLSLSQPGSGNPEIALTYTSLGRWQRAHTSAAVGLDRWFAWGVRTNGFQIPTGSASFTGILKGSGVTMNGGAAYSLSGTSAFDVNFAAATFTGSLHPIGSSLIDGSTRDFGSFTFDRGAMDINGGLTGDIINGSANYLGFFEGALYGPQAQEVAGSFGLQTEASSSGVVSNNAAILSGVVAAVRSGN